jgi:hypothetical protein
MIHGEAHEIHYLDPTLSTLLSYPPPQHEFSHVDAKV